MIRAEMVSSGMWRRLDWIRGKTRLNKYKMLEKKINIKTKLQLTGGTTSIPMLLLVLADDCDPLCRMG